MKQFFHEFRTFIARGNVMDMAVGVIVGGAFKTIADSLVADILSPILGLFAGNNAALAALAIQLPGGGAILIGNFLNAVLSFLITAFAVFCLMKAINSLYRKKEEAPAPPPAPPEPSTEEKLLMEIRDLLQEQSPAPKGDRQ